MTRSAHLADGPFADGGGALRTGASLLRVLAAGAAAGGLLGYVTAQWGRTPAGNTALVVPFAGGPAVLAAGWAVLILALQHGERGLRRLLASGAAAGSATLVLGLAAVFLPAVVVAAGPGAAPAAALLWPAALPLLAPLMGTALASWLGYPSGRRGWLGGTVVALLVGTGALLVPGLGYVLVPLLIPLPLLLPLLLRQPVHNVPLGNASSRWGRLAASMLAWLLALVAGFLATSR